MDIDDLFDKHTADLVDIFNAGRLRPKEQLGLGQCLHCGEWFDSDSTTTGFCSPECETFHHGG